MNTTVPDDSGDSGDSAARVLDGRIWADFCAALEEAGSVVLADSVPMDPQDRAEGWRYLTRLTRASLNFFLEVPDPEAPAFTRAVDETIKMGMDNPDNVYLAAPVRGELTYRMTGVRGTVHYLGFGTQAGGYGKTGSLDTTGYLEAKDIEVDADGRFEIIASVERPPDAVNWLRMSPETRMIQVRQTRVDHENEILAQVTIERIDGPSSPRPPTPERIDKALREATTFVQAASQMFASWTEDFRTCPQHASPIPARKGARCGWRPEHRLLPRLVRARGRRSTRHRPRTARVRLLERPARQLLAREPRLPLLPRPPQPGDRAPSAGWVGARRRCHGGSRRPELARHLRASTRHDVRAVDRSRGASGTRSPRRRADRASRRHLELRVA